MAQKIKTKVSCPMCGKPLLETRGICEGILTICPSCFSSILLDVDEKGQLVIKCHPVQEKRAPITLQTT